MTARDKKALRAAKKEAERKAAARKELIRRVGIALAMGFGVALVLILASLGAGDEEALPAAYQEFRDQPTACGADTPDPAPQLQFEGPEDQGLAGTVEATIRTSCGDIVVALDAAGFPATVESFAFLARQGYYDGTVFHRIAPGFVAQGGDPTATGSGGPGYAIPDEFPAEGFLYRRGVVAMASAGRGTTGSQFFIVIGDGAENLPPSFNVLGEVTAGLEVLDRLNEVPVEFQRGGTERSLPTETVYVEAIEIAG